MFCAEVLLLKQESEMTLPTVRPLFLALFAVGLCASLNTPDVFGNDASATSEKKEDNGKDEWLIESPPGPHR